MKNLVCIICPNGCTLNISENGDVSGNMCVKGVQYAKTELEHPMRTLTTTVKTVYKNMPYLPVRTSCEIPKELMKEAINALSKITVESELLCSDIVAQNLLGLDCNVIATTNLKKDEVQ